MRRLVVDIDVSDYARVAGDKTIERIESMEVLHFIKQEPKEFSVICELKLKDHDATLEEALYEPGSELRVLDSDRQGRYTVFVKSMPQEFGRAQEFWSSGGYMLTPLAIRNGRVTASFLGTTKQIKILLGVIKKAGLRCKIKQFPDARVAPTSPLGSLTERQREVITAAFHAGYYDLPRKVDSKKLAAKLKIGGSDLIKHRRKAERRLLAELLEPSADMATLN